MSKQEEMIKVSVWTLCLYDEDAETNENPSYYYNHVDDLFQRNFNIACAFLDEKSCLESQSKLNVDGLQLVKGTMDFPKDLLAEIITESLAESGLI